MKNVYVETNPVVDDDFPASILILGYTISLPQSAAVSRSAGVSRSQPESAGVSRSQPESAGKVFPPYHPAP